MTTGPITIPMMKRTGYTGRYAAAVEAVSSTGGALLPPIMGAVVFLMVEFTGIAYGEILVAILASSLLYYAAIYAQVHCYSCKNDAGKIDSSMIPSVWTVLRTGWIFVVPMTILVYYMFQGYTPALAATSVCCPCWPPAGSASVIASMPSVSSKAAWKYALHCRH